MTFAVDVTGFHQWLLKQSYEMSNKWTGCNDQKVTDFPDHSEQDFVTFCNVVDQDRLLDDIESPILLKKHK